jgi:hypothetical protein
VKRTLPPSAEIEDQIDRLLGVGVGENPRDPLHLHGFFCQVLDEDRENPRPLAWKECRVTP